MMLSELEFHWARSAMCDQNFDQGRRGGGVKGSVWNLRPLRVHVCRGQQSLSEHKMSTGERREENRLSVPARLGVEGKPGKQLRHVCHLGSLLLEAEFQHPPLSGSLGVWIQVSFAQRSLS